MNPNPENGPDREAENVGASNQAPTGPSGASSHDPHTENAPAAGTHSAASAPSPASADSASSGESLSADSAPSAASPAQPDTSNEDGAIDPDDISHLEEQLADIDVPSDVNDVDALRAELTQLSDDLARARADHYNLNQQYNNYVRRSKTDVSAARKRGHEQVVEALMPVLDDIEAARQAGALTDGPFAAIATKLEQILSSKYEFERFGEAGENFDPMLHEAVMATPSAEVEVETVQQVIQAGYRVGERVVRPAKVIVANPQ